MKTVSNTVKNAFAAGDDSVWQNATKKFFFIKFDTQAESVQILSMFFQTGC